MVSSFGRSFYLAYGIRAGISLALHIIKLLKSKRPMAVFEIDQLVGAHGLPVDAVRMVCAPPFPRLAHRAHIDKETAPLHRTPVREAQARVSLLLLLLLRLL